MLVLDVVINY